MEVFTGHATACGKVGPAARKVMDPFHVVDPAADKLFTEGNEASGK